MANPLLLLCIINGNEISVAHVLSIVFNIKKENLLVYLKW